MFDVTRCHVERTADQHYQLHWEGPRAGTRVAIHMADDANPFYTGMTPATPLLETTAQTVLIPNPEPARRHFFYLKAETGESTVLAERQLPLQGAINFRDLGGYHTREGERIRWGKIYRSGKLSALTDADLRYIHQLGLNLVCDFRQESERLLEPSRLTPGGVLELAGLPIIPGSSVNFIENIYNGIIAVDDAHQFMETVNRDFVQNQMAQYARMFRLLLAEERQMLIHCTAGKDRTGFGAALILDVLGVEREIVLHDYLLTNRYLPIESQIRQLARQFSDHSGKTVSAEVLRPLLEVRPEYINACFDEIEARFESREHFYEEALQLDRRRIEQLKQRYLHRE